MVEVGKELVGEEGWEWIEPAASVLRCKEGDSDVASAPPQSIWNGTCYSDRRILDAWRVLYHYLVSLCWL